MQYGSLRAQGKTPRQQQLQQQQQQAMAMQGQQHPHMTNINTINQQRMMGPQHMTIPAIGTS